MVAPQVGQALTDLCVCVYYRVNTDGLCLYMEKLSVECVDNLSLFDIH